MNRRSVVIVDDLAELRQILRLILEHGGPFRVVAEGCNGEEAVAMAAEHHPDLLLMDVEMPGGPTGWEVLPRLREVAPETLVVILSGSRADQHPPEWSSLASAVLEKGLPPKELNAALLEVLGADTPPIAPAGGDVATADALVSAAFRIERQQRDLVRASAELDAFAAVAGHDLAQPLQVAYGYLEMIRTDYGDTLDPTAASWLDAAVASLERMRVLVQGVLTFGRAGARPPRLAAIDLAAVVDEAVAQLPPDVTGGDWELHRDALPVVVADRELLVAVVGELLANALRFSHLEGPPVVTVSAEELDGEWVVTVADEGPGIPASLGERAFDVFQRGSSSGRGAGLGLATCRKLVEAHGGRIWLEPAEADDGAVVRFSLPRQ